MKKNIFPLAITVFFFLLSIFILGKEASNIRHYCIEGPRTGIIVTWVGVRWYVEVFLIAALAGIVFQFPMLISRGKSLLQPPDALVATLKINHKVSTLKAALMLVAGLAYPTILSLELRQGQDMLSRFTPEYIWWQMLPSGMFAVVMVCGFVFGMEVVQVITTQKVLKQIKSSKLTDQ